MNLGACYSLLDPQTAITQQQRLASQNRAHGTATEGENDNDNGGHHALCRAGGAEDAGGAGSSRDHACSDGRGVKACPKEKGDAVDAVAGAVEAASACKDAGAGDSNSEAAADEDMGCEATEGQCQQMAAPQGQEACC